MIDGKDKEIMIGENRIYLDDNIINLTVVGDLDEETAREIMEATSRLTNLAEGKVQYLIDLNKAGKPSGKARKRLSEVGEPEKIGKVALFGLQPVARVLAQFFITFSGKKDMRFFKTKEETLAWLKE